MRSRDVRATTAGLLFITATVTSLIAIAPPSTGRSWDAAAYCSAGSAGLAAYAQMVRRWSGCGHAGSYPTVTTTLPLACPSPR
jgi:hypothetical protein